MASLLVGRFTGGLANVSTAASAFFGSISGSAPATTAAIACLYGLIVGLVFFRTLNFKNIFKVLKDTAESMAMIMILLATASIFGYIIASQQVAQNLSAALIGFSDNKFVIMSIILIGLLIIGTFLDNVASIILIVPTLIDVIHQAGIDPIYFGTFMVIALAVGNVTPPVGLNLFVAANIAKVLFEAITVQVITFILVFVILLILFIFIPQIIVIF